MRMRLRDRKLPGLFLTMILIVTMALTVTGCGNKTKTGDSGQRSTAAIQNTDHVLGEGRTAIRFTVVDKEGNETDFAIHTDKETVGEALAEHGLIAGDQSEYGLYVKQVNGITADYDVDRTYWAFYVNGEYTSAGVDSTPVREGETYTFRIEK